MRIGNDILIFVASDTADATTSKQEERTLTNKQ